MTDTQTLQARLAEAESALHALRIGAREVEVRDGDLSIKYAPAQIGALAAYVAELRRKLGLAPRAAAIRVGFR